METLQKLPRRTVWFVSILAISVAVLAGGWLSSYGDVNLLEPLAGFTSNRESPAPDIAPAGPAGRDLGRKYIRPSDRPPGFAAPQTRWEIETIHRPTENRPGL
jgi:hypothetical protein